MIKVVRDVMCYHQQLILKITKNACQEHADTMELITRLTILNRALNIQF